MWPSFILDGFFPLLFELTRVCIAVIEINKPLKHQLYPLNSGLKLLKWWIRRWTNPKPRHCYLPVSVKLYYLKMSLSFLWVTMWPCIKRLPFICDLFPFSPGQSSCRFNLLEIFEWTSDISIQVCVCITVPNGENCAYNRTGYAAIRRNKQDKYNDEICACLHVILSRLAMKA